jgi:hypothetical protein
MISSNYVEQKARGNCTFLEENPHRSSFVLRPTS